MGWEAIAPALVVLGLVGVVWNRTTKQLDEKATSQDLQTHVANFEKTERDFKEQIREVKTRYEREFMEMNNRHDQHIRELRSEINGMSDRMDKRFDHVISLLQKTWGSA
jgi:uncharacterized membrane-anchored protein YhcB (DUF1043 family)